MRAGVVLRSALVVCLLLAPVILTLLRIAQPAHSGTLQLVALAPLALPLYALALLVTLVPVIRRRGRSAYVVPAAISLLGLTIHAVWFAPQVTGDVRRPAKDAHPLTVMAANLQKGHGNTDDLVRAVGHYHVDVLGLVEVTPEALAALDNNGLRDRYPFRAGTPEAGVSGTVLLSRIPLGESERLATGFGSWRVAVGEGLTLIAVHTTPPTNPDGWRSSLGEVVADVRAQPTDLILGDFNATADHEPLRQLLDEGYRDAAEMTNHWQPTWPANGRRTGITGLLPPLARIDQVLVGPDLAVLTSETVRIAGTDHLAVVATIAYAEAAD